MNVLARTDHEVQREIDTQLGRVFFLVGLAFAIAALAAVAALSWKMPEPSAVAMLGAVLCFFVVLGLGARMARAGKNRIAAAAVLGTMALGTTALVLISSTFLHAPLLLLFSLFPLIVFSAGVLLGARAALGFGALCLALMVVAWYPSHQSVLTATHVSAEALGIPQLLILVLMTSASMVLAYLFSDVIMSSLLHAKQQERSFRAFLSQAPSALILHRDGSALFGNEAAAVLFGFARKEDLVGTKMLDLVDEEQRPLVQQRMGAVESMPLGSGMPAVELKMLTAGGSTLLVQAVVLRIELPDGPANLSLYFDLTATKRNEAALRRSEAMLQKLFQASPDYVTVSDFDTGRYILVNDGFTRLVGYTREEAIGRTALELNIWQNQSERDAMVAAVRRAGIVHGFPMTLRARDGRLLSVMLSATTVDIEGERCLILHVRDITQTERMRLEYGALMENTTLGIAFTRDRIFQHANPYWERMFGWEVGTLAGHPGSVVWPAQEDYLDVGRTYGPLLAQGKPVDFERSMARRDGSVFVGRIRAQAIDPLRPAEGGTIWVVDDITDRLRAEKALATARDEAQAANSAKSTFLAAISHELRTPLNGLLGLSRLGLDPKTTPEQTREYLARMHESAQSLNGIVSDLLDLSKIEAGKLAIESISFDLREVAGSVYRAYRDLASETGLLLNLQVDARLPDYVRGDPLRVRQILANFLSNALKFTQRGRVEIRVEYLGGDQVRIAIEDTGIGIDEATRSRLFTPFSQADASTTRRYGGTGLGLAICRQLAALMGGRVGVDSEVGVGSTFWAELPLPTAPAPVITNVAPVVSLAGLRVLLVEDNPVNQLVAEAMLRRWGVEVVQANDGRAALAAVEREYARPGGHFDAILMDVHMPGMTGPEATVELRKRFDRDALPVIALTAALFAAEQEEYLAVGMNECVAKPIEPARLHAALSRWAGRRAVPDLVGNGTASRP